MEIREKGIYLQFQKLTSAKLATHYQLEQQNALAKLLLRSKFQKHVNKLFFLQSETPFRKEKKKTPILRNENLENLRNNFLLSKLQMKSFLNEQPSTIYHLL